MSRNPRDKSERMHKAGCCRNKTRGGKIITINGQRKGLLLSFHNRRSLLPLPPPPLHPFSMPFLQRRWFLETALEPKPLSVCPSVYLSICLSEYREIPLKFSANSAAAHFPPQLLSQSVCMCVDDSWGLGACRVVGAAGAWQRTDADDMCGSWSEGRSSPRPVRLLDRLCSAFRLERMPARMISQLSVSLHVCRCVPCGEREAARKR